MSFSKQMFSPSLIFLAPRYGFKAVKVKDGNVLIFGGGCNGFQKDVVLYNIYKNNYQKFSLKNKELNMFLNEDDQYINGCDTFSGLAAFDMVYLSSKDKILIFGGLNESLIFSNEMYELENYKDLMNIQAIGDIPCPRIGHTFTKVDENKIVLFGGVENLSRNVGEAIVPKYLNDVYVLHIENDNYRWEFIDTTDESNIPCPRESHSAVYYRNMLVVYGGMNGYKRLNDTWLLDMKTFKWIQGRTSGVNPICRSMHTATLVDDKIYIFGGYTHDRSSSGKWKTTNSLQCLDLRTMKWKCCTATRRPDPRASHAAIENHGRIFYWSGRDDSDFNTLHMVKCHNDVWYYESKKPSKVENLNVVSLEKTSFKLEWFPSINAVCYVVELKERCDFNNNDAVEIEDMEIEALDDEEEEMEIEYLEEYHPTTIIVTKSEKHVQSEKVEPRSKPKIVIHENTVLSPPDKIDVDKTFKDAQSFKVLPSDIVAYIENIVPVIEQFDGAAVDVDSTDSEMETFFALNSSMNAVFQNYWYLVGIFKDISCNVKSYTSHILNKPTLTSEKIPNLIGSKQFTLVPGKTYSVRVSALNSCGLSEASEIIKVKMEA